MTLNRFRRLLVEEMRALSSGSFNNVLKALLHLWFVSQEGVDLELQQVILEVISMRSSRIKKLFRNQLLGLSNTNMLLLLVMTLITMEKESIKEKLSVSISRLKKRSKDGRKFVKN